MRLLPIFLILISLFSGCQKQNEIEIGVILPLTGPIASFGQEAKNGILISMEKWKDKTFQGKKIKLIFEDNKGEPLDSSSAAQKLISANNVMAIIGSVASSNTLAIAPIAQSKNIPLISPASTNEKVTTIGDYISRACFTDNFQGLVLAKFAYNSLGKRKAAIVIDNNSDYSKGLAKVFKETFSQMGGTIIDDDFSYVQKDNDFRSLFKRMTKFSPDVVFVPGYYQEVGLMLKQAKQAGINAPFFGGDGWDSPKLFEIAGPEAVKGNYISSHFSSEDVDPIVVEFVKKYKEQFNDNPGAMAALGHDAMELLGEALSKLTEINSESLKNAINATKDLKGVTGNISLDANRNAQKSAVILETAADRFKFKEKVNP